jgi:hypothetical protein
MYGTNSIVTFCDVTRASDVQLALIYKGLLVELVGIEPTTSSLRTMRSQFSPVFRISGLRSVFPSGNGLLCEH